MNVLPRGCWNKPPEPKYYGLVSYGATCYLNSVLQVLFMTEEFKEAVNSPDKKHIDHHLKKLFEDLQQRTADPYDILEAVEVNNVNVQQDAAEYFERILRKTSENAAQIFHGRMSHRTTCLVCKTVTDSEGPFWHLPLELESDESYSVEDGMKMFFTPTKFDGENQMYCEKCDAKVDASRKYVITHHPNVLVLLLKRFDFSYKYMSYIKINCNAEVPHTLKIPENQTYELYALVEHFGDIRSGHYKATIHLKDDKWCIFNDTTVSSLDKNPFPGNINIAQSVGAYLLFYRRKDSVIMDVCPNRDPNSCTIQDSNQILNEENLQEGDDTEPFNENSSHMSDSTQTDSKINQINDKERLNDSLFTEAKPGVRDSEMVEPQDSGGIEQEKSSLNERSDEQTLIEEQTDRNKQTEGRGQYEMRYNQVITMENAEMDKQEEISSFLPAKYQIQDPDAGKTEPMKTVNIQTDINTDNNQSKSPAPNEQEQLNEAQRLIEINEQTGKNSYLKDNSQFSVQCPDSKEFNTVQQEVWNQDSFHLDDDHQRINEMTDYVSKAQTQEMRSSNDPNFYQDSPNVAESEEGKQKDDQNPITRKSGKNKKVQGKKEKHDNTERIENDLDSHSKVRQAEEDSQAGKWEEQKEEYSDNATQPFHEESREDIQWKQTGQQVPSHDRQSELDLVITKKKNYRIAASLTGNQGSERDEERSLEYPRGYRSNVLDNAEERGHSSSQIINVDVREIPSRGQVKKKILVKTIDEETLVNESIKRKKIKDEGNVNRESEHGVSFSVKEERITICEPLLPEYSNPPSKEVTREANKDECRLNVDGDTELETLEERKSQDSK